MKTGPSARPADWKCGNCVSFGTKEVTVITASPELGREPATKTEKRPACCLTRDPILKSPEDFCFRDFRTTWPGTTGEVYPHAFEGVSAASSCLKCGRLINAEIHGEPRL